jgi:uncharacterized protein involved in exopolysaccharide biosynthesis
MSPQSSACQERQKLAQQVADAIATVYRLRNEYSSAQAQKSANADKLLIKLSEARGAERIAESELREHIKEHGCVILESTRR